MKVIKLSVIALIVVGILGLVYGCFTYFMDTNLEDN